MENPTDEHMTHIKGAVEALLFVNERPVTLDQIRKALETVSAAEIKSAIQFLQEKYESRDRGMIIKEIAGGYQMLSNAQYAVYVRNFFKTKHKEKLSKPALETLAIVAYKQPVTRADVEEVRGVNSDGVVNSLMNKELIKLAGRKDVPGKPYLYSTARPFLEYFGLKSLSDLPKLEDFSIEAMTKDEDVLPLEDEDRVHSQIQESEDIFENEESGSEESSAVSEVEEEVKEEVKEGEESSVEAVKKAEEFLKEAEAQNFDEDQEEGSLDAEESVTTEEANDSPA